MQPYDDCREGGWVDGWMDVFGCLDVHALTMGTTQVTKRHNKGPRERHLFRDSTNKRICHSIQSRSKPAGGITLYCSPPFYHKSLAVDLHVHYMGAACIQPQPLGSSPTALRISVCAEEQHHQHSHKGETPQTYPPGPPRQSHTSPPRSSSLLPPSRTDQRFQAGPYQALFSSARPDKPVLIDRSPHLHARVQTYAVGVALIPVLEDLALGEAPADAALDGGTHRETQGRHHLHNTTEVGEWRMWIGGWTSRAGGVDGRRGRTAPPQIYPPKSTH